MILTIKKYFPYVLLLTLAFILSMSYSQNPFARYYWGDSAVYEYIGKSLTEGYFPYRDIFDHKGPFVYLIHALGFKIYPMFGIWYLKLIWLFLTFVLLYKTATKFLSPALSVCLMWLLFSATPVYDTVDNTEAWAILPLAYTLYLTVKYIKTSALSPTDCLLLGFSCVFLVLTKPLYLSPTLTLYLFFLIISLKKTFRQSLKNLALYGCIGFFLPFGLCLLWLHTNHALPAFYEDYINFNLLYTTTYRTGQTFFDTLLFFITRHELIFAILSIITLCFCTVPKEEKHIFLLCAITLIISTVLITLPMNTHANYAFILYPTVFILMTLALKHLKYKTLLTSLITIGIILNLSTFYKEIRKKDEIYRNASLRYHHNAELLNTLLPPDENFASLFEEDTGCLLFLYSHRHPATRYPMIYVVFKVIPQKVKTDFVTRQPRWVVIQNHINKSIKYKHILEQNQYLPIIKNAFMTVYARKDLVPAK